MTAFAAFHRRAVFIVHLIRSWGNHAKKISENLQAYYVRAVTLDFQLHFITWN
ncbi:hypothetical protein [Paraburkholderia sp. Ac-20347]|jgi:hypothetical protein|uniref:hypothetical protein n=1 Tax=Paraburkholderia sp. Ac-20347 TaxID=2703892 RepID=UPI0019807D24|nr:hypothetical protein [Paraburkholderia sp. Ac-20347]MBN3809983.1 hypothetical protein [Paraburkholderia sp. Ac-20347]